MAKAFAGLRVIDFTQVFAGPYATALLGYLDAEVIKIEPPIGDQARGLMDDGPLAADRMAPVFQGMNAGKRSIALNLKHPDAVDIAKRLVRDADVVVENSRPGVMARLGLDYATLRVDHEDLIYCSISGYGQTGPKSEAPAYDGAVQAASGMMSVNGQPDDVPLRVGFAVVDMGTAITSSFAIASALFRRAQTGEGQYLDVSMLDTSLSLLGPLISNLVIGGTAPQRLANQSLTKQPTGDVFPTADGSLQITALKDTQIGALCETIGQPGLLNDPRFATPRDRLTHHAEMRALLIKGLASASASEWETRLSQAGVPVAKVMTIPEVLADPQIKHRTILQQVPAASGSELDMLTVINAGFTASVDAPEAHGAPPRLGEHTESILDELGYDAEGISALRAGGAI
jgi:CoA:oxalate CoA-transferase